MEKVASNHVSIHGYTLQQAAAPKQVPPDGTLSKGCGDDNRDNYRIKAQK